MALFGNSDFSNIITFMAFGFIICAVSFVIYRFIYAIFCYKGIQVYNDNENTRNENNNDDTTITVSNIIPFSQTTDIQNYKMASCIIDENSNSIDIDNTQNLPIATIV